MKNRTKILWIASSVVLVAGIFVLGVYIGYDHRPYVDRITGVTDTQVPANITADFEPFWKVWNLIDEKYPGASAVTAQDRVYGAIQGLVNSLGDPYSVFFPPQDSQDFAAQINGSFDGIGLEVGAKDGQLTVIAPLKNTPAAAAGLQAGDVILKIDDTTITGDMSVDQAVDLIRGPKGSVVKLTIGRPGQDQPIVIPVTRDTITIPTINEQTLPGGIYDIQLYNFSADSDADMTKALEDFKKSGDTKLVIDLRENPGGYLDSAVDIASYFLPQGDVVVTEGASPTDSGARVYRSKGYNLFDMSKIKVAVLVDKGSASASEILSGALQEHGVAPLIGETTYGKGSVQEVLDVTDSTTLKLTVAKWFTPNGTSISEKGLTPDIPVTVTDAQTAAGQDPVQERAVQYLETGK